MVRERKTVAVLDGHNGMGHVVARQAMDLAIAKARAHGMGMTAVRNSTHYGIAGYYALMATRAGMIGITGTNARPSIAPTLGVENMLGTNPLTIGLPTDEAFPFILDCATSVTQRGKIESYAPHGQGPAAGLGDRPGGPRPHRHGPGPHRPHQGQGRPHAPGRAGRGHRRATRATATPRWWRCSAPPSRTGPT